MLFPMKSFFGEVKIFIFRQKTMDYSPWFHFCESKKILKIMISSERASQDEQIGANFSFVVPSSERSNLL